MNLSLVGKQLELTDGLKAHIENVVESLEKYHLDIQTVRVIASSADKNGKKGFAIEFIIQMGGRDSVVIRQMDKDLYAAVDLAIERAKKALRRYHDKLKDHKNSRLIIPDMIVDVEEEGADYVIEMDMSDDKPMTLSEAKAEFLETGELFFPFKDENGTLRLYFRRKDGKIGLY